MGENIGYGQVPSANLQTRIEDAARVAEAWDFIQALPDGLATSVGERGQTLSGGQRQRIAIARAVLKNSSVLIKRICQGRTTLVVAHRLSTIRHSDQIVVMDLGKVAEKGTHEELVALDGIYAGLWRLQTGEG